MSGRNAHTRQRQSLIVRAGRLVPPSGPPVEVSAAPVVVGRDEHCGIVLADPEVSGAHCEVLADAHGVLLRDLESKNGTFVGPVRAREVYLTGPCTLTLGGSTLLFEPVGKEHVPIAAQGRFGGLVGGSISMRNVFGLLEKVAPIDVSVLITGETGTGKELAAQAVHEHSPRKNGPFVVVDCTSIVASLAESILFGYERDAFTGAHRTTDGLFQEAHGGTIFLDEIGELPLDIQPKLLRALDQRRVRRVGGKTHQAVDVRVIAATHRDLRRAMNAVRFREDLYYRVAQLSVELPPLRDRREDIPAIVRAVCAAAGVAERADEILAEEDLGQRSWPGNVRELVNVVQTMALLPRGTLSLHTALVAQREPTGAGTLYGKSKRAAIDDFDRRYFRDLHEATEGNVSEMARRSGLERHHVRAHLKRLGIRGAGEASGKFELPSDDEGHSDED